ncbi:hypothetical protein FKM82_031040 [Ascaphus truei]
MHCGGRRCITQQCTAASPSPSKEVQAQLWDYYLTIHYFGAELHLPTTNKCSLRKYVCTGSVYDVLPQNRPLHKYFRPAYLSALPIMGRCQLIWPFYMSPSRNVQNLFHEVVSGTGAILCIEMPFPGACYVRLGFGAVAHSFG